MNLDPTKPAVAINKDEKGNYVVTVYGATAYWPSCNTPEPKMTEDKSSQLIKLDKLTRRPVLKDGKEQLLWTWGVQLAVPKNCPGISDLQEACMDVRKTLLNGLGKIVVLKDGDKEADAKIAEGKNPEYQEWMRGNWIISANFTNTIDKPPIVRNEIYAGAIVVAVFQPWKFEAERNKGVKGFLREIGRVAPGTRIEFGVRKSTLEGAVKFEEDAAPVAAPAESPTTSGASTDSLPWE